MFTFSPRRSTLEEDVALWPGQGALGRRVGLDGRDAPSAEVIGIAADAKYRSFDEESQP